MITHALHSAPGGPSSSRLGAVEAPITVPARRGSVMIEFAFVALAFTLLMAGTIEIGRTIYTAQILQNAARAGARELSMRPLPATATWKQIFYPTTAQEAQLGVDVREYVYDAGLLVKDVTGLSAAAFQSEIDSWPIINKMLYPLMLRETLTTPDGERDLLHFPGALVLNPNYHTAPLFQDNPYSVSIPKVMLRDAQGHETITWVPVVEEVVADGNPDHGPFSLTGTVVNGMRGVVAMRINMPYQASTMSAFDGDPLTATAPNTVVEANDSMVTTAPSLTPPPTLAGVSSQYTAYAGPYGLGKLYALGKEVRPFRRLISAQSMFRREVLAPPLH